MTIIRVPAMFAPFHYAFVQRGLLEILLLSVGAGLLGTWVVLRGLAFYSHAVATAAFPGLVVADGLAFSAPLGAFAAALAFAFGVERLGRGGRDGQDTHTALVLVGALALGVVLASDVFHSAASVETLLFGSLLLIGRSDLILAAVASAAVLLVSYVLGRRWLALGFDPAAATAIGARSPLPDAALLVLVALGVVSALAALGALLAAAIFVVPAATVRLVTRRLPVWQLGSVALVAVEGVAGLWLSVKTNVPPGAAVAVVSGAVFALVAAARAKWPIAALAGVLLLAGCGSGGGGGGSLSVVATTTQIADWARVVGGADVDVHQILQPNTDPHEYEPRPRDVVATAGATVVLENGDGLDHWMADVISKSGAHPTVVDLGGHARTVGHDPHWWNDPRNAERAVTAIRDAFRRADPTHARAYARRAAHYTGRLRALDRGIAACLSKVPRAERKLVTDHDAFGALARRYGITVVGAVIPSQTTLAQPSAGELARLIDLIRREHVAAVFPESSLSPRLARAVSRETGTVAGYTLYGDSLGPRGSAGATYLGMEEANADALVRGFTDDAQQCRIGGAT